MEEYITRAEFERLLKEEVQRQLKEQRQTDEIPAINVNVASQDVTKRLDTIQEDTGTLKIQMEGARADIRVVKANQGDIQGYLENHSQRLESIEQKQDAHAEVLGKLISFAESHDTKLDRIDSNIVRIVSFLEKQGME